MESTSCCIGRSFGTEFHIIICGNSQSRVRQNPQFFSVRQVQLTENVVELRTEFIRTIFPALERAQLRLEQFAG